MYMMKVSITTVDRTVFKTEEAAKINAPTTAGQITILPRHASLTASLGMGEIIITDAKGSKEMFFVDKGVIQIHNDVIEILADMAEKADELDEAKIEEAKRHAEALLKEKPIDIDIAQLETSLQRELQKAKLVKKWRNNGKSVKS